MNNHQHAIACATWYAWGRQDAQHDPRVDVFKFAEYYVAQRTSHGQSIQDAFATYVAKVERDALRAQAATAPVLADSDEMQS